MTKSNEYQKISRTELYNLLCEVQYGEFTNILTTTIVGMSKKVGNPYYNSVVKVSKKNVRCLPDYEKRVRKVTENPDFQSQSTWFVHDSPCVVSKRSDMSQKYFLYEQFENQKVSNEYTFNGDPIEKEVFSPYLPNYSQREILVHTVKLENIRKVSFRGVKYEVED